MHYFLCDSPRSSVDLAGSKTHTDSHVERAAMIADRKFAQQFSISQNLPLEDHHEFVFTSDWKKFKDWMIEKRFHIVGEFLQTYKNYEHRFQYWITYL